MPFGTLTEIARRYHLEGQSQDAIARDLALSRMKVHRLLRAAQDQGLAEIRVHLNDALTAGPCRADPCPAFVPDAAVREGLMRNETVRRAPDLVRSADHALVEIGDLAPDSQIAWTGWFSAAELREARRRGMPDREAPSPRSRRARRVSPATDRAAAAAPSRAPAPAG